MNPVSQPATPRRRIWPWVLGFCLAPLVILGLAAASFLTLEHNAAVLRRHVMAATDGDWDTRVQISVGRITLGAVRTCLAFVHHHDLAEAREALAAVRHASVGVYERTSHHGNWSRQQLFADTDQAMEKRGWMRLVGVADKKETVLIYVPQDMDGAGAVELCLAVVNDKELVVVSTSVDSSALADLVEKHSIGEGKGRFHLARFRF